MSINSHYDNNFLSFVSLTFQILKVVIISVSFGQYIFLEEKQNKTKNLDNKDDVTDVNLFTQWYLGPEKNTMFDIMNKWNDDDNKTH